MNAVPMTGPVTQAESVTAVCSVSGSNSSPVGERAVQAAESLHGGGSQRGRWRCSHSVHHIFNRSSSQSGTSTTRAAGP